MKRKFKNAYHQTLFVVVAAARVHQIFSILFRRAFAISFLGLKIRESGGTLIKLKTLIIVQIMNHQY